ncbi:MAG TPA: hypothetical protein ENM98_03645, partial [Halothiobacillaceae bacterium]|nr:hypothetical protein [Halothiobacillaceae bacterium]
MRTERRVDTIVFDWLREGLDESVSQLLAALESLSESEQTTEPAFDAMQALKTLDNVLAFAGEHGVRVLIRNQHAALDKIDRADTPAEPQALSAQVESAHILRSIIDRLIFDGAINKASLLPMTNRLREQAGFPEIDATGFQARGLLLEQEFNTSIGKSFQTDPPDVRSLLKHAEREALGVIRHDWSAAQRLAALLSKLVAEISRRSVKNALLLYIDALALAEVDPERIGGVVKRSIGRLLKLLRLLAMDVPRIQVQHLATEAGAILLTELTSLADKNTCLLGREVREWQSDLNATMGRCQFLGVDLLTLQAVQDVFIDELGAVEDVLDL